MTEVAVFFRKPLFNNLSENVYHFTNAIHHYLCVEFYRMTVQRMSLPQLNS
jgi:hypothetical protein